LLFDRLRKSKWPGARWRPRAANLGSTIAPRAARRDGTARLSARCPGRGLSHRRRDRDPLPRAIHFRELFNWINASHPLEEFPTRAAVSCEYLDFRVKRAGLWRLYRARAGRAGLIGWPLVSRTRHVAQGDQAVYLCLRSRPPLSGATPGEAPDAKRAIQQENYRSAPIATTSDTHSSSVGTDPQMSPRVAVNA
jgi:hypothetical protein